MKSLLIIRHAKSSWSTADLSDFDRPLNDRGKRDAPAMAKLLVDRKIVIDTFVSSSAKRAKKTAQYFCEAYGKSKEELILKSELYHATTSVFYDVINNIHNDASVVAVFSHNPGITEFVNTLTSTTIDNMPTCSIFAIHIHTNDWSEFETAEKIFWFFETPKFLAE